MKSLRAVFDATGHLDAIQATQALIRFRVDGVIQHANQTFLEAMGYSLSEIVGRHHRMFLAEDQSAEPAYQRFWAELAAGHFQAGEFERRRKDGSSVTLQATYSPIRNRAGHVTGILKLATVVDSRRAERERADRLLETLDLLPVPIMTCDPTTYVIDYANKASIEALRKLERYLPIKADELVGSSIDIFHKRPEHQRRMLSAMTTGHQATIRVGPEALELKISIISGRPVLVWYVVTHRVAMAEGVYGTVANMENVSTRVSDAAGSLAASVTQTVQLAGSVAAAAEEQAAAIGEVAKRTGETAGRADTVGDAARTAETKLRELVAAVDGISAVVATVSSIAAQTKLLALNATIEAARAGEVGRGFAVVASEVKALSDQTALATDDIGKRIAVIQSETERTAEAVEAVITGIGEVVHLIGAVAAATEEQRAVSEEVSLTITQVADNARSAGRSADDVSGIATLVQRTAGELKAKVDDFMKQE